MTEIKRGFRCKLDDFFNTMNDIIVDISVLGNDEFDSCCFAVDSLDKLSDENYMVFYNQLASPKNEIVLSGSGANTSYTVRLSKLPHYIHKLVFTVSIDGNSVMSQIKNLSVKIRQASASLALNLTGASFSAEKAIIAVELYKKDVWRLNTVASGFNGGLSALLKHYGGEEAAPEPVRAKKVSLEKRIEKEAPQLLSLIKPLKLSLEKHKLGDIIARVGLVLDISGSMSGRYSNGTVQEIVNKTVPLAVQFDDDGELDLWYYGSTARKMISVNTKNYREAVPSDWRGLMRTLGGSNNEPAVMRLVIDEYSSGHLPAYVLFITDGGVANARAIKKLMIEASEKPIFWQFLGIGGSGYGYGVLQDLDTMKDRKVDNANFFALDDFRTIDNAQLYARMLGEFPLWLKEARRLGILR